ncbi:MAG: sulfatase-like hydrolase/transferase [Kiritimatiellia bacterium]|jgi:arylsulfatase|nr:sulfatase-like hydrolase/transferase [Kiritimatiellia bacterium]MDP6629591.1 sulfatase-like hydrolase/transferase [Kiritimatiellia bacterium]MDP6809298.1 sulfatase-like hydrolase/transferase [Kiritimatiellia bacterium]MDP7023036.1 sulfatase-like hydrolase/transferase [Kiritimatiellia bacterium]
MTARNSRPNIIYILDDDMGYGDVSCYGPEFNRVATPNIDLLAKQGMSTDTQSVTQRHGKPGA